MFDTAFEFIQEYRKQREKALNNEERAKWFTAPVASMDELMQKFDSATENDEWEKEYLQPHPDLMKMQSARLKVHWLASTRQDLRGRYVLGGDGVPLAARTSVDHDRHNFSFLKAARYVCQEFKKYLAELKKGSG